ncbi:MAG: DUF167 domain-containing protein [Candidatus Pacebacteria bacterium]|nr:DUF167 domain-containing protein [Candidatus Paceibacterota bacterium]
MNEKGYVRVRVKAGTRKERILQVAERVYTIEVREKAERGEANARVRALLADILGVRPEELRLVKGATSPSKVYLLA